MCRAGGQQCRWGSRPGRLLPGSPLHPTGSSAQPGVPTAAVQPILTGETEAQSAARQTGLLGWGKWLEMCHGGLCHPGPPPSVRVRKAKGRHFIPPVGAGSGACRGRGSRPCLVSGRPRCLCPDRRPAQHAGPTFVSNLPERSGGASRLPLGSQTPHRSSLAPSRPRSAPAPRCRASSCPGRRRQTRRSREAERGGSPAGPPGGVVLGSGAEQGEPTAAVNPQGCAKPGFPLQISPSRLFVFECWVCVFLGSSPRDVSMLLGVRIRPVGAPVPVQTQRR